MSVRVIYGTEANLRRSGDQLGQLFERDFASIDEAKRAPVPNDAVFAYIPVESGYHVWTKGSDWEEHVTK
jgi:hypothetical protein